ncbi:Spo0E family sporulation regulatory protein-aspartic acid phosphatase [Sporosarcina siberiensis]|uniref:Spo0E family sporulation regulatory protein-aspartic acid phosphatase n=1 Tax=Sporosarcina siberiensis TaxID=1365606 RepID=A0ABW4SHK5_9BACL
MLEMEIESTREEMIQKALEVGFNNSVTLGISCKLDQLLNQLEKIRKTRMFYGTNECTCMKEFVGKG